MSDPTSRPADPSRFSVPFRHRLLFTRDAFHPDNRMVRDLFPTADGQPCRCLAFVDAGVAAAWPDLADRLAAYADAHAERFVLAAPVTVVPGGEAAKNDTAVFDLVARAIHDAKLCRHSYVLVIGGGAVLDAVGYAAAVAHRGVRLIRFPTTTLAQDDAGIGVKNGINAFGKKNFLGTFAVPWAVVNDERFLTTLSPADWRSGLSEAVKVALLKDADFFDRIGELAGELARRDEAAARVVVRRSAELHLDHIVRGGDPFEMDTARPLDFGHWSAHKLEQMTGFRIRHGEAVAIGVALDVLYSVEAGHLDDATARRVLRCLFDIGFSLYDEALTDTAVLLEGLEEFREHLGGRLTITLLEGIGRPVDVHEIEPDLVLRSVHRLAELARARRTG